MEKVKPVLDNTYELYMSNGKDQDDGNKPHRYHLQYVWHQVGELKPSQGSNNRVHSHQTAEDLCVYVVSSKALTKVG
ncbi:hypothetical protein DSO57_1027733 [Entomophthora muscae]|uniref:Uncharacterized protein n=1 Tax=Entomophthora muscae TaxID=34485 RepID=A0ACC2TCM2_9FUNG|nr:hypothetical protein DSO57_1027733 [Entomophthora muscae]